MTAARYTYEHPAEQGFGDHHADPADPPLAERPAQPFGDPAALSMADLDLPHGTTVEHLGVAEDTGFVLAGWTDSQGNDRITSVPPEFFTSYFREA